MHPLVRDIERALRRLGVERSDAVCVGCSGGADSTALADAAMVLSWVGRLGPVTLVHVDHGLRPGSAAEADRVQALADAGGARFRAMRAEVDTAGASLERAAREARYAALDRAAGEQGAAAVLLAHTATDQAETVLMRILRGTGVAGLSGIPARRGRYVRPLLEVSRERIEAYVAERSLAVLDDPMNRDPRFFRTRVRHRWLPALRQENPHVGEALCRLAASAGEERQVLDWAARTLLERAGGGGGLDVAVLQEAPSPALRRALAMAVEAAGGGPVGARHLRALEDLVRQPAAGTVAIDLPRLQAVREYDRLRLGAGDADGEAEAPVLSVRGPGGPYRVRPWRPGDRMRPARLGGRSRKLSDLYTDAKIPRRWRARARVVVRERDGVIEWAEHVGPAHGATAEVSLTPADPAASNKGC